MVIASKDNGEMAYYREKHYKLQLIDNRRRERNYFGSDMGFRDLSCPEPGKPDPALCVILRESKDPLQTAREALERHLDITAKPDVYEINVAKNAIPQLTVGHHKREYERVCTVSLNNCIIQAKKTASQFFITP